MITLFKDENDELVAGKYIRNAKTGKIKLVKVSDLLEGEVYYFPWGVIVLNPKNVDILKQLKFKSCQIVETFDGLMVFIKDYVENKEEQPTIWDMI